MDQDQNYITDIHALKILADPIDYGRGLS